MATQVVLDNNIRLLPDSGCEFNPSCLSCSLCHCVEDFNEKPKDRNGKTQEWLKARAELIADLVRMGHEESELRMRFGK